MKKTFLILFALAATVTAVAQRHEDNVTGKQFYAELGGPGVLFSANFDSRFERNASVGFGYRVGVGFGVGEQSNAGVCSSTVRSYITFPVGLNYVFGKSSSPHAFEVGAGATVLTQDRSVYTYGDCDPGNVIGHFEFMYRLKPIGGGFTWRIGFTPILGTGGDLVPSGVIGVGYSF